MVVSPRQLQPRKPQNVSFICTQDLSTYIEVLNKAENPRLKESSFQLSFRKGKRHEIHG